MRNWAPDTHRLEGDVRLEHGLGHNDGLPTGWRGGEAAGLRLHPSQDPCQQQARLSHAEHVCVGVPEAQPCTCSAARSGLAVHT